MQSLSLSHTHTIISEASHPSSPPASQFFELEASEESEEEALERQIKEVKADIKKTKAKKHAISSKKKLLKRLEKELELAKTGLSGESDTSSENEMVIVSDEDGAVDCVVGAV